jgi:hypothetical protein
MEDILTGYESSQGTWLYYSFLLIIAVFFKFNRLWSLRNLDLLLILAISPGLLLVRKGEEALLGPNVLLGERYLALGYGWLFVVSMLLLIRLLSDNWFKRRPRLDQNLNVSGMVFLGISAIVFLAAKTATEAPPQFAVDTIQRGQEMLARVDKTRDKKPEEVEGLPGPTVATLAMGSQALSDAVVRSNDELQLQQIAIRIMTMMAHLAVISGLIFVGYRQFGDVQLGIAMSLLYLLLPCTAFDIHRAHLVIPSALIVWAFAAYRRPILSGSLIGFACGAIFFPVFLLPIWLMFYRKRGIWKFTTSLAVTGLLLISTLILTSADTASFRQQLTGTIDWNMLRFQQDIVSGFWLWNTDSGYYRIPVFVCFVIMIVLMTLRSRKNLEELIADSAAIVVGTQFWYTASGGVYILWYLPLLLLVIFRPRLTHLVPPDTKRAEEDDVHLPTSSDSAARRSPTGAQVLR